MVKENCEEWNYGTFNDFKRKFNERKWYYKEPFKYSLFNEDGDKYHASIIKFDGCGMILNPIDFWRAERYVKKYVKNKNYAYLYTAAHHDKEIHHSQTKEYTKVWREATFNVFKEEINKREWKRKSPFFDSIFADDGSEFHASIISFSGVGMLLSAEDFKKAKKYVKEVDWYY